MRRLPAAAFLLVAALAIPSTRAGEAGMSRGEIHEQLSFAADMAKHGNWHEALFRWQKVLKATPQDPRLLNNLAVAWETMGEYDKAEDAYQSALRYGPDHREIRENYALFHAFYDRFKKALEAQKPPTQQVIEPAPPAAPPPAAPPAATTPAPAGPAPAGPAPPQPAPGGAAPPPPSGDRR